MSKVTAFIHLTLDGVIAAVAMLATLAPAGRAARADPVRAMRAE